MRARSDTRSFMDDHTRITLLEDDMDAMALMIDGLGRKLDAIRGLQMAILVSLATGAVLFAMNLVALATTR